jgi:hypothetical protein
MEADTVADLRGIIVLVCGGEMRAIATIVRVDTS